MKLFNDNFKKTDMNNFLNVINNLILCFKY